MLFIDAGWSSLVARRAHNPKVIGSNPIPATNQNKGLQLIGCKPFLFFWACIGASVEFFRECLTVQTRGKLHHPPINPRIAHGFVESNGAFTSTNALGAVETYANSIDASGQVSGVYIDALARRRLPLAILPRP